MKSTVFFVLMVFELINTASGSHFLGGTITWRIVNASATGSPVSVVITQTYSWLYGLITCTNAMIAGSQLIGVGVFTNLYSTYLNCVANCGNDSRGYVAPNVVPHCTDVSAYLSTTIGQRSDTVNLEVDDDFAAAFKSNAWRTLTLFTGTGSWSISTRITIKKRSDNGLYNNAPVATMMSPLNIPVLKPTIINVPIADMDGDIIRCRWSTSNTTGVDECGGVCPPDSLPINTVIYPNCTIIITGPVVGNWFAVAIMVEDFIDASSTTPLSGIPVQFLVHVVNSSNCILPPKIIGKPVEQSCTSVIVGETFTSELIAKNYCGNNVTIVDIATLSFPAMVKGNITALDTMTYRVSLSWIPTIAQLGYQVMCAMAFDSENSQSAQYCFKFYVAETDVCSCPGEPCLRSLVPSSKENTNSFFIGISLGLLIGGGLLFSYIIYRCCCRPGLYANTSKKKTIFELYHIEKCVDIHCLYNSTSIKLNHIEEPSLKDREIGYPSSKIPLCKKRKQLTETTYDNSQIGTIDLSTIGSTCKMVNTTNMKNLSMRTDGSRKKQKKSKKSNKLQIYVQARRNKSTKG